MTDINSPKAAILQRDKETYAIAPHTPGGLVTPAVLRKIADVAEKYNAAALKMTSSQRMAIVGLRPEDVESVWNDLGMDPGHAVGMCVRSVRFCPGTTFCKRGQQDAVSLGLELDKRYHGMDLPQKLKIAVAGCQNSCPEAAVRDIGIMGTQRGWTVMVGGNGAGYHPRIADIIAENIETEQVLELVEKTIDFFKQHKEGKNRLGCLIDEIGIEEFKKAIDLSSVAVK